MEPVLSDDELKSIRKMLANSGGRFDWDGKVSAFWAWAKPFATLLAVGGLGYLGFTGKEASKDAAAHAQTATAQSQQNGAEIKKSVDASEANGEKVAVLVDETKGLKKVVSGRTDPKE